MKIILDTPDSVGLIAISVSDTSLFSDLRDERGLPNFTIKPHMIQQEVLYRNNINFHPIKKAFKTIKTYNK